MKNKLMKVSLLLFLMALIVGKSLSQNQPVKLKRNIPPDSVSTDIELMREMLFRALSLGKQLGKTGKWDRTVMQMKWKPNVYRGDASYVFL